MVPKGPRPLDLRWADDVGIAMAALGRATEGMCMLRRTDPECKDAMGQSVLLLWQWTWREGDFGLYIPCLFLVFVCLLGYWNVGLLGYFMFLFVIFDEQGQLHTITPIVNIQSLLYMFSRYSNVLYIFWQYILPAGKIYPWKWNGTPLHPWEKITSTVMVDLFPLTLCFK